MKVINNTQGDFRYLKFYLFSFFVLTPAIFLQDYLYKNITVIILVTHLIQNMNYVLSVRVNFKFLSVEYEFCAGCYHNLHLHFLAYIFNGSGHVILHLQLVGRSS